MAVAPLATHCPPVWIGAAKRNGKQHHHDVSGTRGRVVVAKSVGLGVSASCSSSERAGGGSRPSNAFVGRRTVRANESARWSGTGASAFGTSGSQPNVVRSGMWSDSSFSFASPGWRSNCANRFGESTRAGVSPPNAAGGGVVEVLDTVLGDGYARDAGCALAAAVAAYLWVKLFDVLAGKNVLDARLSRKIIHTTSGPFFMLTWPLFGAAASSQVIAALVPTVQAMRLFAIGSGLVSNENAVKAVSREGDKSELLGGPFIYTLVLLLVTAVCWRGSPGGIAALSMMCAGDGLADIVGRRLGRGNALPWNKQKSLAGSVGMFVGGLSCSLVSISQLPHSAD